MNVVHVLTELELFSETRGGAISRWVGSVLPLSRYSSVVVCPESDGSWRDVPCLAWFPLRLFRKMQRLLRVGPCWPVRVVILALAFRGLKRRGVVQDDSVICVQNRIEYVLAFHLLRRVWGGNIRIVLHMHNDHLATCRNASKTLAIRVADRLLFCSRYLLENSGIPAEMRGKAQVVVNGADPATFFPKAAPPAMEPPRSHVISFVGRLVPEKGVHVLIAAVSRLRQKGVEVKLRIIGEPGFGRKGGPYSDSLRTMCPDGDAIAFVGYRSGDELAKEYRQATIFCCPSIWNEPFGMINVEAMASAVPVVASRVGGIPEILEGGNGVLVPAENVEELADALESLLRDDRTRSDVAAKGYATFLDRYTWEKVAAQYDAVIASLSRAEEKP
jgi:spore coat protein SA